MASGLIISWQIDGETVEIVTDFLLLGSKITAMVTAAMKLKDTWSLKKSYDKPRLCIYKKRHQFANKGLSSQKCGFSSHVWMRVGP